MSVTYSHVQSAHRRAGAPRFERQPLAAKRIVKNAGERKERTVRMVWSHRALRRALLYSASLWHCQISIGGCSYFGQITNRRGRRRYASDKKRREALASPLSEAKLRLFGQFEWA